MGVTAIVVVLSSRVCLGFSFVVVVGLRLSWSDESWPLCERIGDCVRMAPLIADFFLI